MLFQEVEPLAPPAGATPGDKLLVEGYESGNPDEQLNPKKKVWDKLAVDLKVSGDGVAQWQGNNLASDKGPATVKTVKDAPIK